MLRNRYRLLLPGRLILPLFRARLVAHVGGAGEVAPGDLLGFLDVQESFFQCLLVDGAWEIQSRRQRVAELVVGKGTHFLLEHGHLSFSEARTQVIDHEGYELAFLRLAVRHRCLLECFRRSSLQRKGGCVQVESVGPTPGAEISALRASASASMAARASPALLIRACSERTKRVYGAMASLIRSMERPSSASNCRLTTSPRRSRRASVFSRNSSRALRRRRGRIKSPKPAIRSAAVIPVTSATAVVATATNAAPRPRAPTSTAAVWATAPCRERASCCDSYSRS